MDKKKLKQIPIKELSWEIKKRFVKNRTQSKEEYLINAYVHEEILVLDIYKSLDELQYRLFQAKDDFITWESITWRTSSFENLFNVWPRLPVSLGDTESERAMQSYLDTQDNPIQALKDLQYDIRKVELGKKHKKITDKIDELMNQVQGLPKGFNEWLEEIALSDSRYIFYTYKKGGKNTKGYCTHCKKDVEVDNPKHGAMGKCPNCRSLIKFRANGRGHNIVDRAYGSIIQKIEGGFVLREFSTIKNYIKNFKNPELTINERNRLFYYNDKPNKSYRWDYFKQTNVARWCEGDVWMVDKESLYPNNLDEILKGTDYQYSALKEFVDSNRYLKFNVVTYFDRYRQYPAMEYFIKLGLIKLTSDVLKPRIFGVIKQGTNLKEVTGISKQSLNRLINIDGGIIELVALRESEKTGISITDEEIKAISNHHPARIYEIFNTAKYSTIHLAIKYLGDNKIPTEYDDYLEMANKLGWDMTNKFILFPRNLDAAHKQVLDLTNSKTKAEENIAIKKLFKTLQERFKYEDEDYIINAPKSAKEIIREGHELHHCVGGYAARVARKETVILFFRRKIEPYKPFFTIQIDPETLDIVQIHGKDNCPPNNDIKKRINNYKKNLKQIAC